MNFVVGSNINIILTNPENIHNIIEDLYHYAEHLLFPMSTSYAFLVEIGLLCVLISKSQICKDI